LVDSITDLCSITNSLAETSPTALCMAQYLMILHCSQHSRICKCYLTAGQRPLLFHYLCPKISRCMTGDPILLPVITISHFLCLTCSGIRTLLDQSIEFFGVSQDYRRITGLCLIIIP
jgi:hypothetical protein